MFDLSATRDHIKYTLTLAGVGTAYVQALLGRRESFFGLTGDGVETATLVLSFAVLALFLLSTVSAILALGSMTGVMNLRSFIAHGRAGRAKADLARAAAGGSPLPPAEKEAEWDARARHSERAAVFLSRWHLRLLWVGFLLAALFYADDIFDPPRHGDGTCESRLQGLGDLRLTYPCGAPLPEILKRGSLTP